MNTERVLYYFDEISKIPRASGDEGGIADYLEAQGRRLKLSVFRDKHHNVILKKQGKADSIPVILQAHTDMVWETELESESGEVPKIPMDIHIEDGKMKARGTTLGADDGIGVALILALLEQESGIYPDLEAVFTANEEETMEGAISLQGESLKGRYLVNLDSEEEGTLTVGAAGGLSVIGRLSLAKPAESQMGRTFKITVKDCCGGHSGLEIHKDRENALLLLVRLLQSQIETAWELVSIEGGSRSNAIPEEARAYINTDRPEVFREQMDRFINDCRYEWMEVETGLQILMDEVAYEPLAHDEKAKGEILLFLENLPHGVYKRREEIIYSSANLAIVRQTETEITAEISLRSTYETWLEAQAKKTGRFIERLGGTAEFLDGYAAWMGRSGARLTEVFSNTYRELFHRESICETVHAGVECGIILKNCPSVQEAISVGPTILHAHTVHEELDVDSVGKVYTLLDLVLKSMG